jgi:hypothetical protein
MLTRQRYREVPPRVDYELTERSRDLMPVLAELARWGYEWAWSAPRATERIDIGAILRLAPGLVAPPRNVRGSMQVTVSERKQGGGASTYFLTASSEGVTITEQAVPDVDASVSGSEAAWVKAFSPEADRDELEISGNRALADALLDVLAQSGRRAATGTIAAA